MVQAVYSVTIVVDPAYGERLTGLPEGVPVWIAESPVNREVAERLRRERPSSTAADGITVFAVDPAESPADWCAAILGDVDLHHGQLSHDPPYGALDIIGATPTTALEAALREYGLGAPELRPGGFRCVRSNNDL